MHEFLFGDPNDRHEIIFANDKETAIHYFHAKTAAPELYVPDKYIKTDDQGVCIGIYHDHLGFLPEYTSEACIPFCIREQSGWHPLESILLSDALKVTRRLISGPRRLAGDHG